MNENEEVIWKGRPSQLLNFWTFVACVLLIALAAAGAVFLSPLVAILAVVPFLWGLWKFLVVRCRVYELTTQRLRMFEGVVNQDIDEIELYRVKDTTIRRPFILRLFNLSNIDLLTSDRTHHTLTMSAIHDGVTVREHIRKHVESIRDKKRVREVDFDSASSDGDDMEIGDDLEIG